MNRHERLLRTILRGRSDANIRFDDLRALMQHLGFEERVRASHHVYRKAGVAEKVQRRSTCNVTAETPSPTR